MQNEKGDDGTHPFVIKDTEPKVIPLAEPLIEFLVEYGIDKSPYLIKPDKAHGNYVYRWEWKKIWGTYMKSQGLGWVTAHTMRHTFVTLLLSAPPEKRPSLLHVSRWTGDSTDVLKKSYAHLLEDRALINAAN